MEKKSYSARSAVHSCIPMKRIPWEVILPVNEFILLRILEIPEYDENKQRTGNLLGYTYQVVNTFNFDKINVKIKGQTTALMPNEKLQELREAGKTITVEFVNPTVLLYYSEQTGRYEDSFSADDIRLVKREN